MRAKMVKFHLAIYRLVKGQALRPGGAQSCAHHRHGPAHFAERRPTPSDSPETKRLICLKCEISQIPMDKNGFNMSYYG